MEQVFAPWRIEWVERDERNPGVECVFCDLPKREADRENLIVARGEHAYLLLNNYPYNPGHAMVVPHHHTGDLRDLDDEEALAVMRLQQRAVDAIETAMGADGFNVGLNLGSAAGGSIGDHLHVHVVPRWQGDTNFMAVTGDTKVIVEALDATWERLHAAFADQEGVSREGTHSAVLIE